MTQDPEAIRILTRSYRLLRGYEMVPPALALVALHLVDWRRFNGSLRGLLFILLTAVTISAFYAIQGYYNRRFGVVAPLHDQHPWRWVGAAVVFVALQIVSNTFGSPVQLGFLAAGIAVTIYAVRHFAVEGQRLLFAVVLIVMSVLPPIDDSRGPYDVWHNVFAIALPATFIVMAIWDHHVLVKLFERARGSATNGAH